jgi:predicted DNA-binding protein (MmcQ/YjbR family)
MARRSALDAVYKQLLDFALALPEATLDHPWGENVAKVKKKVFVFSGMSEEGGLGFSVKLPRSGGAVLMSPFAKPTGYGLGKSGWVSLTFGPKDEVPSGAIQDWIIESYKAVAPKKLADLVGTAPAAAAKKPAAKKSARKAKKKRA